MITVLVGGDVCPIGVNMRLFVSGDAPGLFGGLLAEFQRADLSVVNLECPLIGERTPITKSGPVLGAPPECVNGMKAAAIDVVNLGNNHIMDHGVRGFRSTLAALREHDIDYVGAGEDLEEARRILIRRVKGTAIGILSMAEHEFNIAAERRPGANPLDLIEFVRSVRDHNSQWDHLIVLFH